MYSAGLYLHILGIKTSQITSRPSNAESIVDLIFNYRHFYIVPTQIHLLQILIACKSKFIFSI